MNTIDSSGQGFFPTITAHVMNKTFEKQVLLCHTRSEGPVIVLCNKSASLLAALHQEERSVKQQIAHENKSERELDMTSFSERWKWVCRAPATWGFCTLTPASIQFKKWQTAVGVEATLIKQWSWLLHEAAISFCWSLEAPRKSHGGFTSEYVNYSMYTEILKSRKRQSLELSDPCLTHNARVSFNAKYQNNIYCKNK